ncbi:hypothetical protein [Bradyrhizobium sp. URHD0069]|uniref:hypothetical protein n=1 Tax=Bradyrhizobium sp. URHD0069 TaxID=1380355 RepID=UPI0004983CA4|nr:hypothetical protein [Bradyrhizobium sp. URHD0069]
MLLRTSEQLLKEIRGLVAEREPVIRGRVKGKLFFLTATFASKLDHQHSPLIWILRAQIGTLDKLKGLLTRDGEYETFELLAIARNLFENLVWLRLFNRDPQYGLVFYEQLLIQQKQNTGNMIAKVEGEIALFEEYDKLDGDNLDTAFASVMEAEDPSEAEVQRAGETHRALTSELDMRVRRNFALYAAAAQFNSYAYQCHLLREEVIPRHRATLTEIETHLARYEGVKNTLLTPAMLTRAKSRWNWSDRAREVGMKAQYDFLYSYTSKLLHATPMNLITEKALSPSEALMLLDYAFVTINDLLDETERFSFPGQADVLMIEV